MTDMYLEERMSDAVIELRDSLVAEPVPLFVPSRSRAPLAAAAALLVLLGVGVLWSAVGRNDDPAGEIIVATQPDGDDSDGDDLGGEDSGGDDLGGDDLGGEDLEADDVSPESPLVDEVAQASPLRGQVTAAAAGEFIVPLPGISAWNVDETAVLLYRTGETEVGHVVLSSATGELLAQVDLSPPDIEQVYWHPTDPKLVIAVEKDALWSFDIMTGDRNRLHTFENCPFADADAGYPSPPSTTGTLVVLCGSDQGVIQLQYNMLTAVEISEAAVESVVSVHVSPMGSALVSVLADGSAVAQAAGSNVSVDLGGDVFTFVVVDGIEQLAAARYDGQSIGSLVVFDLVDASSRVIIGPDAGDGFPPAGTQLSSAGSRLVISTKGPADDDPGDRQRAGHILLVDLTRVAGDEVVASFEHRSGGTHGYWSNAFVSLSPSGRYAVYSTDDGGDRVNAYLVEFPP